MRCSLRLLRPVVNWHYPSPARTPVMCCEYAKPDIELLLSEKAQERLCLKERLPEYLNVRLNMLLKR